MIEINDLAPPNVERFRSRVMIVAGIAILLAIVGFVVDREQFFKSYLLAYMFWIGLTVGSLGLLMMQHMTGGAWGMVIRRNVEAATRLFPLMFLLFAPLLVAVLTGRVYIWAQDPATWTPEQHEIIEQKARYYLNIKFFIVRVVIYFAIWILFSRLLNKYSRQQDETGNRFLTKTMSKISGPGLVICGLMITFAVIDWTMSLDPTWYSTIWGIIFIGGQLLSAMAFSIIVLAVLSQDGPLAGYIKPLHFHDLGKLTLAFTLLWAYFSVSQLIILWSGNIPEEAKWYARRLGTSWKIVGLILVLFHFALPYLVLLSRNLKRNPRRLIWLAVWIIIMRYVDLYWLMGPELHGSLTGPGQPFTMHWLDIVMWFAIGGIWLWFWAGELRKRPLLPLKDPFLEEALHPSHH
jgi:F0F1-type ATP synthase membrane subunit c/vacuolar-type H+-ATPase subunit K